MRGVQETPPNIYGEAFCKNKRQNPLATFAKCFVIGI